jgi:hypothetical protein
MKRIIVCAVALIFMGCTAKPSYQPTDLTWEKDIKVIFVNSCYECHGLSKTSGDLNFMSNLVIRDNIWKIYKMVVLKEAMPPKNNQGISLSQIDRLRINTWIRGNAPGIGSGAPY